MFHLNRERWREIKGNKAFAERFISNVIDVADSAANLRATRQSIADAAPGEIPIVAHKKNREPWLVTTTADGFFRLYREYETPKLTRDEVTVMVFALRYASNRETFAPTIVADVIISKIPLLSEQERENLTNEIMRGKKFSEYNHRALPEVERILEALAEVEDGGKDRVI